MPPAGPPKPIALWIGCSDSRVIPEQILDADPGELLVLRNMANLVPPFGVACDVVGSVVEYAVLHMRVHDIVICGHTECAGIMALRESLDLAREPHRARWIEWARPALAQVEASGIPNEEWHREAVRANVLLQLEHLRSYPCVRDAVKAGELRLHGWHYGVRTGVLEGYTDPSGPWCAF